MRSSDEILISALRTLASEIQSDDGIANAAIAEAADRLEEKTERLNMYERLFSHALDCVDKAFQSYAGHEPILPDFLGLGECKFRGVVKLAEAYKELLERKEPR